MRGFIFGTALIAAEANNRSFCKTIHADIPNFCNCTDTAVGGTASCHVQAASIETVDVTLDFLPCGEPASLLFDFAETAKGMHQHVEATAGFDKQIDIDRIHVNVPRLGNATLRTHVTFDVVDGHLQATMDLDACGTILGKKGCGSDIPRVPLPHKVISIDRDIGGFCDGVVSSHTKKALEEKEEEACDCSCLPAEGKWRPFVDTFGPECDETCSPYVMHRKCDGRAECCGKSDIKEEVATHSCNSAEHSAIKKLSANEFGDKSNKCGKGAYNIISGKFNHDKFNSCLSTSVGISSKCSECYAKTGEYGASKCKKDCLLGWCKQGCLTCTAPAQNDLPACTGMANGTPKPCMDEIAV